MSACIALKIPECGGIITFSQLCKLQLCDNTHDSHDILANIGSAPAGLRENVVDQKVSTQIGGN